MIRRQPALDGIRKHPVLAAWLGAQLGAVGYVAWVAAASGAEQHHAGMLLSLLFGILLFPGGQVVMALLVFPFSLAEQFGVSVAGPLWVEIPATILLWASSAWLTYKFWKWASTRAHALWGRRKQEASS